MLVLLVHPDMFIFPSGSSLIIYAQIIRSNRNFAHLEIFVPKMVH